jgi:O-antigen ligase
LLLPALFLGVGAVAVLIAVERGAALREFRWTIVEPLLFYALLRVPQLDPDGSSPAERLIPILGAFVLSGAIVGVFGLLQFVGIDIVEALLGTKRDFAENIVPSAGLRRVASVFGHPNNLGLYLERVWPIAVVLALIAWRSKNKGTKEQKNKRTKNPAPSPQPPAPSSQIWFLVLAVFLCLGGLFVSFSRGAWLGSAFALLVLALPFVYGRLGRRAIIGVVALVAVVALLAGVALLLRGDPTSGSTWPRLMIWQESLALIARYPFGLGMDQFYYYHNPEFGRSLINPALIGTSEQYVSHPHNFVLDIWLRMGPLGVLVFVWLLARFFRRALGQGSGIRDQGAVVGGTLLDTRAGLLRLGALAAMVAALIHGLVDNFYFLPELAISFWLLLAVVESQEPRTEN